jgi:alkanesulfonate monooxygenase SsuD/methylene tetrahydromethanopterin reductase-like flavin-dependent oxidoreductase (luciferase family)
VKSAIWVPLFDELADPAVAVQLAVDAEEAGWDGFFLWDHVNWRAPVTRVADPWMVLGAVAARTTRLQFGPMVTPLARRRPVKLARETATLDQLSGGRFVLGAGLGSDRFGREFSATGEETDDRVRAELLDESLEILTAAWSGKPVHHQGKHHTVDDLTFLPAPAHIPIWIAGFPGKPKPLRRAARYDGFFPVNLTHQDQVSEITATLAEIRGDNPAPFDLVVALSPETDPAPYEAAGATWRLVDIDPEALDLPKLRTVLRNGPR